MGLTEVLDKEKANFNRNNRLRLDALERQDPANYAKYNGITGLTPEDIELHERGVVILEQIREEERKARQIERQMIVQYEKEQFIKEANRELPINLIENFGKSRKTKERILVSHYPKFGPEGSQPIQEYTDKQIGAMFHNMYHNS